MKNEFVAVFLSKVVATASGLFELVARRFQDNLPGIGKATRFAGYSAPGFIDYLGKCVL